MPRLRRADVSKPGWTRRRRGRGWTYLNEHGEVIRDPDQRSRLESLVLPPAWQDVWIAPHPNAHIQATGFDAKGRRQYRYHDAWTAQQQRRKFDEILDFAAALLVARPHIEQRLRATDELTRERVLACALRLLDLGFFRIGSEEYAEENHTYGLATIRREHVTVGRDGVLTFDYTAKSGKHRVQQLADDDVRAVVAPLRNRRTGGEELLAYRRDGEWVDVRSSDINEAVREMVGQGFSAKDFRTWSATVLAAVGLAVSEPAGSSPTASKRAVSRVVKEVAAYLGNTPAVARSSYIHPRVIDLYQGGRTISEALGDLGADTEVGQLGTQGAVEQAVLDLLRDTVER